MAESQKVILSAPKIIGAYSLDKDRNYINDITGLKYLKLPNLESVIDLNEGKYLDKGTEYDTLERIKQITRYIMEKPTNFIENKRVKADFVCFRGTLSILMAAEYIKKDWIIKAAKLKDTIYFVLELKENNENLQDMNKLRQKSKEFGYKFESYALASSPDSEPKGKLETVYEKEEFCVLMSRDVDKIKVIFGAEIDGVDSETVIGSFDEIMPTQLIELKTHKLDKEKLDKNRTIEWWCQSFIASVDNIYVGYHTGGIIKGEDIKKVETKSLKPRHKIWSQIDCIKRLKSSLTDIKSHMDKIKDPNKGFSLESNSKEITVIENFLPQEYVDYINNL